MFIEGGIWNKKGSHWATSRGPGDEDTEEHTAG